MEIEWFKWLGFGLSFLAAFIFSLFYISLSSFSRIAFSRFLEDREKEVRHRFLQIYDNLKVSFEFLRILFLIAFFIYLFFLFPALRFWPLWLFFLSLGIFFVFFELIPRLLNAWNRKTIFSFFLAAYRIPYFLTKPILFISKIKESDKESLEDKEPSEEEIQAFIVEAQEEGIIQTEEGPLLKSVVEFGDTIVREIMTPRVDMVCIPKKATIRQLRDLVIQKKHSRIPVYEGRIDNITGIINAKDLLKYLDDNHLDNPIEPLIRPPYFIPEAMKVAELLKEFQKRKQKLAIVVDEHGGVSGLVTMEDLMEEIVGEIQDEYDEELVPILQQGINEFIVRGDVEVDQLEDLFDLELAEDDYVTVGGLITHHLGRLPEKGEKITIKNLTIEILDADQKRIKKLRIKKEPEKIDSK
ncbi:hemolysin family protein [Candidatus Aminicenantes bacterium AC-334-K16]|jgi:CBS domain containing-hemolysin-like protein|nr:hemolysin family protein [Candidatus Aminicenantes bacterium AC-334-K16]